MLFRGPLLVEQAWSVLVKTGQLIALMIPASRWFHLQHDAQYVKQAQSGGIFRSLSWHYASIVTYSTSQRIMPHN